MTAIKMVASPKNKEAFAELGQITKRFHRGIKRANFEVGRSLKRIAVQYINEPPKTGRVYRVKVRGEWLDHQASAPGESPANMTGNLKNSLRLNFSGDGEMTFYADEAKAPYAEKLEEGGGNVLKRPYMIRAIESDRKNTENYYYKYISGEFCV